MLNYTTPEGTYDQPYIYVFDGTQLTDGNSYKNLFVYIQAGVGDFYLRRIAGIERVANPVTGQIWVRDYNLRYIEGAPVFVQGGGEWAIVPELKYPETSRISFDIYNVLRAA